MLREQDDRKYLSLQMWQSSVSLGEAQKELSNDNEREKRK
jgi:hypothetical protein